MSEFYKMRPGRWNTGTDDLTLEQEAAYLRVVNAIHLHDHPVRNNMRVLAGLWRCNERKAKRLLNELVEAGKLQIEGEWVVNELAMDDVSIRRQLSVERASAGRRGGIESGKTRRKSLKNNDTDEASALTRIEENRIEEKNTKKEVPKRATRMPEEFPGTAETEWATSKGLSEHQVKREVEKFTEYWSNKTGRGATKLDWSKTWKVWVNNAIDRGWVVIAGGGGELSPTAQDALERKRKREQQEGTADPVPVFLAVAGGMR